jgi:hypothetical protein
MLQNAQTSEQFELYLEFIINIFTSKYINTVYTNSVENMIQEIKKRNIVRDIINENQFDIEKIVVLKEQKHIFPVGENIYKVLKNESPFKGHYSLLIKNLQKTIEKKNEKNLKTENNMHYVPLFLDIIYNLLHILPLWTGILVKKWNERYPKYTFPSRFSNNPCENHFKITKHTTMKKEKKIMPSKMASLFYTRIQAKYLLHYENKEKINFEKDKQFMFYEKWSEKPEKRGKKTKDKQSYFSNFYETEIQQFNENEVNINEELLGIIKLINLNFFIIVSKTTAE